MSLANVQKKILVCVVTINKEHPKDVGLSYFSHLKFAWGEMIRLECMAIVMFIHGVVPWIWDKRFGKFIDNAKERIGNLV